MDVSNRACSSNAGNRDRGQQLWIAAGLNSHLLCYVGLVFSLRIYLNHQSVLEMAVTNRLRLADNDKALTISIP